MGTIDGDEFTGVTIDGEEVTEITVDGDTVWEAMTVYDDFENSLANWYGQTSDFGFTTSPRWWGDYALRVGSEGGSRMINYTGMSTSDQPGAGDNFSIWFQGSGSDVGHAIMFCDSAATERVDESSFYQIELRTSGAACHVEYWSSGTRHQQEDMDDLSTNPEPLNTNQWYRCEVYIRSGDGPFSSNEIGCIIRQPDGTAYQQGSLVDSTLSSGYLGIRQPHDNPAHYYDYLTDQVGADTV